MQNTENLSEKESLQLITEMINKTKQSIHETGLSSILWGSVITFCSIMTFLQIQFDFSLPFDIWILTFIAVLPQIIIAIKESKSKQVKSYNDIAMDFVWIAFGICMFLLIHNFGVWASAYKNAYTEEARKASGFVFYEFTTSFYLLLYGLPTFITGGLMKFKPMIYGGILCWIFSVVSVYTNIKIDLILMAIGALTSWLIPGLILNARYRKAKANNV